MARTRLFGQLRRIAAGVLAERRAGRGRANGPTPRLTRRQLTWGAAQLVAASAIPACGSDDDGGHDAGGSHEGGGGEGGGGEPTGERVAVVGAGIAGLHCAYRLQQAGVEVMVFEAASRVGGRMFTARDEDYDGQLFELGGELIDSNHTTLMALAEELGIALDDRFDENIQSDVWFVNGAEVPEATIVEQFQAVASAMADAVTAADDEEDDTAFNELDQTPLASWLDENVPAADYPELNAVLISAYRGEFGLETEEQSALNLLYLIGSDEPDPFRIFGESDERYHAHEGSDAFPFRLAQQLSAGDALRFRSKLTRLSGDDERGFTLTLVDTDAETEREERFQRVVIAMPFSVLRKVKLDVPLSDLKRQIIDELGYGTNAKVMGQFETRVWREDYEKSGTVTSDLPLQQVWDSSIGQPGDRGILTNFLGGRAGVEVGEGEAEDYYTGLLSDLDKIFPGAADAYRAGSARRMHWPSYEHTRGSYTCYKPGQWSFWGNEGLREGNVHFCGEHTSVDFQGWMEGGAETGARAAAEILEDLGLELPPALSSLIEAKSAQPPRALPNARARFTALARWRQRQLAARRVRP